MSHKHLDPKTGLIEEFDEETGELISFSPTKPINPVLTLEERCLPVELTDGRTVLVDPKYPSLAGWEYNDHIAGQICEAIAEGGAITKVLDGKKFPKYSAVSQWRKRYPEFNQMINEALECRAEMFADKLRELADDTDEDNYSSRAVQIQAYKHLAAVDNPRRMAAKSPESVAVSAVTMIVVTGVPEQVKTMVHENDERIIKTQVEK